MLIPGASEYVSLHGKRVFTDVIKSKDLSWGEYPGFSKCTQCNHKVPDKRKKDETESESEA